MCVYIHIYIYIYMFVYIYTCVFTSCKYVTGRTQIPDGPLPPRTFAIVRFYFC